MGAEQLAAERPSERSERINGFVRRHYFSLLPYFSDRQPASYQEALLSQKMFLCGVIIGSASNDPAGIIKNSPLLAFRGTGEPHLEQKL